MKGKEFTAYIIIVPSLILTAVLLGLYFDINSLYIMIMSVIMCVIYIIGIFAFKHIYKKITLLRIKLNEDSKIGFDDKLSEGEIGKLADAISNLENKLTDSEVKQLKEKEFLRDIISDISHQIKTPVASLTVFNDILINEIDEKHKPMIEQSGLQIERIKWLVLSMLQLARIEAASIEFDIKDYFFEDIIKSCIDILAVKAKEKNINFNLNVKNETVRVDNEWFKEALINIIKNAIEYSPENNEIDIEINKTPMETRIYIKDYGVGIPESDRLNIFKRFYTVHSNQVNPNSVGLGLALSKSIIEGMNGRIWVESRYRTECKGDEKSYTRMVISLYS